MTGAPVLYQFVACYTAHVTSVTLAYHLKLYPSVNKTDTLAALAALFSRTHADVTTQLARMEQPRQPSTKGMGQFLDSASRRAGIDWKRQAKATPVKKAHAEHVLASALKALPNIWNLRKQAKVLKRIDKQIKILGHMQRNQIMYGRDFKPPYLKAELIDSAEIQQPRKATGFDLWVMVQGTTTTRGRNGGFYVPAKKHHAINRTLALPGATLNESAEVYRKGTDWYARVSVSVPLPEIQESKGWLGCDVGVRSSVVRSDGYHGHSLKPVVDGPNRCKRKRRHNKRRYARTFQRQILAKEARRAVLVAQRSSRGVSLEDPERLPQWGGWAARMFAKRVELLASVAGVAVRLLKTAYSSRTCRRCFSRDTFRRKEMFRCCVCGFTRHADENAALNLASGSYTVTGVSHGFRSLPSSPSGGGADA